MQSLRSYAIVGLIAFSILLLAACGASTNYGSSSAAPAPTTPATTAPTSTTNANQDTGNAYGKGASATSTSTSTSNSPAIKAVTATVSGKTETVLANAQGLTLYYFTPDTTTTSACTGGCASNWPPLLATGSGAPTGAAGVTGKLTTLSDANGQQLQYNGHFLYTFAGDSASGQANGQGVGGKWYVVTAALA